MPALALDDNFTILAYNAEMEALTGYNQEEATKLGIRAFIDSATTTSDKDFLDVLKTGKTIEVERGEVRHKSGKTRIITGRLSPMMDKEGKLLAVICGIKPADASKLEEKVYLYEQILDSLPWPLSVTDNKMNWLFINKPVETMLGVKRADMMGKHCSNWGAGICKTDNCGIECLRAGKPRTFFEQQNMNFQVDIAYIKDPKGERMGHIEIVQDVTIQARERAYRDEWIAQHKAHLIALAKGDLNFHPTLKEADQYTQNLHDIYKMINGSLVEARDAMKGLVVDAEMLSKAAVEGKLSTRADVSKHQGEYRKRGERGQRHAGRGHRTSERGGKVCRRHLQGCDTSEDHRHLQRRFQCHQEQFEPVHR